MIALAALGAATLLVAASLAAWAPAAVDDPARRFAESHRSGALTTAFRVVTELGAPVTLVSVLGVAAVVLVRRLRLRAAVPVVAVALGALAETVLKALTRRARPPIAGRVVPAGGFSFPSGHATAAFACAVALVLVLRRLRTRWANPLALVLVVFAIAVAASRVYLGVHWLSDVVGGAGLGTTVACVTALGGEASSRWLERRRPAGEVRSHDRHDSARKPRWSSV